jgi:hypothetical protein
LIFTAVALALAGAGVAAVAIVAGLGVLFECWLFYEAGRS